MFVMNYDVRKNHRDNERNNELGNADDVVASAVDNAPDDSNIGDDYKMDVDTTSDAN
jgi:hypothetical protein